MKKNNDAKDYSEQLEFLNSEPYYASKKIVNRTVTKKHCFVLIGCETVN